MSTTYATRLIDAVRDIVPADVDRYAELSHRSPDIVIALDVAIGHLEYHADDIDGAGNIEMVLDYYEVPETIHTADMERNVCFAGIDDTIEYGKGITGEAPGSLGEMSGYVDWDMRCAIIAAIQSVADELEQDN